MSNRGRKKSTHCSKCSASRIDVVFPASGGICRKCLLAIKKERRKGTVERDRVYTKKYNSRNRGLVKHCAALQRARKHSSIPAWADLKLIKDMYDEAHYFDLQIDHVIPLNGRNVCGLHWEGNLQAITEEDNYTKGNFYVNEYSKSGEPTIDFSIMGQPHSCGPIG